MNSDTTWQIVTTSSEQTEQLGAEIGAKLRGGEIIELRSDVGGGKTTFTRGLARGAGSKDIVSSPSFTISREYHCPNFVIFHYDFYRLDEAGIMATELNEHLGEKNAVVVVEWGDIAKDVLLDTKVTIDIKTNRSGDREIELRAPSQLSYLKA